MTISITCLDSKAYVDDDEPIESVMEKFQALESKKSTTPITISDGCDSDKDSEDYGSEYNEPEFFYALWLSQIPNEFRNGFENHEEMIQKAIYEWDDDEIKSQEALALKKLGKLREGDDEREAALKFWLKFLRAVVKQRSNVPPAEPTSNSQPENSTTQNFSQVHYISDSSDESSSQAESRLFDSDIIEIFDDDSPNDGQPRNENREIVLKDINFDSMILPRTFDHQLPEEYKIKPSILTEHYSKNLPRYFISENNITNGSCEKTSMTESDLSKGDESNHKKPVSIEDSKKLEGAGMSEDISESNEDEFEEILLSETSVPLAKSENKEDNALPSNDNTREIEMQNGMSRVMQNGTQDNTNNFVALDDSSPQGMEIFEETEISNGKAVSDETTKMDTDKGASDMEIFEVAVDSEVDNDQIDSKEITKIETEESEDDSLSESYMYENFDNSMSEEVSEYARFLSELQHKDLNTVQKELTDEIQQLNEQQRKEKRDVDTITQTMINECQELLKLFGIPFINAPMEAEAQCAELLRLKLVNGIITDDCDVFLFGGTQVYKNFFDKKKYVECYLAEDFEREFQLDREKLIKLALLLGSDYSEGLPQVGIVTAMEVLNEFPEDDGLEKFRDWWLEVQYGMYVPDENESEFKKKFVSENFICIKFRINFLSPFFF